MNLKLGVFRGGLNDSGRRGTGLLNYANAVHGLPPPMLNDIARHSAFAAASGIEFLQDERA